MENIYDNGTILLGTKKDIINYWKNNTDVIDNDDKQEIEEYLKEIDDNNIVAINYDNGFGWSVDYWEEKDKLIGGVKNV